MCSVTFAVTLRDLRKGSFNCLLVERLACFGAGTFIWDILHGVLREEGGGLMHVVDGVSMATLAWKGPHVSRIGDSAQ